jgi:hypothetical protein
MRSHPGFPIQLREIDSLWLLDYAMENSPSFIASFEPMIVKITISAWGERLDYFAFPKCERIGACPFDYFFSS